MSINMSNVKSITLGGAQVKKIEDTSGVVLWQKPSSSATINLTVGTNGSGQDATGTQYFYAIRIPSSWTIQRAISNKTGIEYDSIKVTKVELDLSTLYWYNDRSNYQVPKLSTSSSATSSTTYFGSGTERRNGTGKYQWGTHKIDVTKYMNTRLFGYNYGSYIYDKTYYAFSDTGTSGSRFCTSSSSSTLPIFTIVVTYEY